MKFSRKKNFFKGIVLVFFTLNLFSQGFHKSNDSELSVFNEVNSAFYTGFYPGAVDKADLFIKSFPESVFIVQATVIKGESLVNLGRYAQAAEILTKIIPSIHLGDENYERSFYFLGKSLFYLQKYDDAVKAFYECCKASLSQKHYKYYNQAMLYSARSLFVTKNYSQAVPVMEYIVNNKSSYSQDDYNEILQRIMICYNKTEDYSRNRLLFDSINKENFSDEIYNRLLLQNAISLDETGDYKAAYSKYCSVIQSGIKDLAVISLKKAYLLTTKAESSVDSAELFEITRQVFGSTSLVCEFWVRLGIDSYVEEDYVAATNYLKSAKENNPLEFRCVINLYEQKIRLQTEKNLDREKVFEIRQLIENEEKAIQKSEFENIQDVYYSTLIQCYALENNWKPILSIYEKCKLPDEQNLYFYAMALYNTGNYSKVNDLIGNKNSIKFLNLLAKNSVNNGDFKKAREYYEKLIKELEKNKVDDSYFNILPSGITLDSIKTDYVKVLYNLGEYDFCLKICGDVSNITEVKYISGLCAVRLNAWKDSISYFEDYIKAEKLNRNQFYYTAVYYLGYANYILGSFGNSYKYFVQYNEPSGEIEKKYPAQAYELAAKSALQLRKYDQAAAQGEKLIQILESTGEKQTAVLFTAEIYVDGGYYKSAIDLLQPWCNKNDGFAIESQLKIAQIYQKNGNLSQAEQYYENVVTSYGKTVFAEEALYDCGEMFYSKGNYEKAEDKFSRYIYKYVDGKFAENALFFSADCNFKLEKYDRSVMLNNRLCQKYPQSTYLYGTYKNLLEGNYLLKNYTEALVAAKYLNANFELQAKNDGIPRRILELEKILSGSDTLVAKLFSEFEQKGGIKTVAGRHKGTELVQLYVADEATKSEGIILALQLLPLEQGNLSEEVSDAAMNASLIADWYRGKSASKDAAQHYLLAAEYYRSCEGVDEMLPSSALYSAVEAFVADGLVGDARETAKLLKSLYPKSRYASAVDRLIK